MGVIEEILRIKDEASPALKGVASEASTASSSLTTAATAAGGIATALLAAGAAAFAFQQKVADLRNDLGDMAARTGVASRTIAGLKLAAEGSGLKLSDMEGVVRGLNQSMIALSDGSAEGARAFDRIGVKASDLEGLNLDQQLALVAERLQGIGDTGQRAQAAMDVLGRSGGRLMQALGDQRLGEFIDRAERFGLDIGPDAAAAASDWQREVADLRLVLEGFAGTISDTLAPATSGWLHDFNTGLVAVVGFIKGGLIPALKETAAEIGGLTTGESIVAGIGTLAMPAVAAYGLTGDLARRAFGPGTDQAFADVNDFLSPKSSGGPSWVEQLFGASGSTGGAPPPSGRGASAQSGPSSAQNALTKAAAALQGVKAAADLAGQAVEVYTSYEVELKDAQIVAAGKLRERIDAENAAALAAGAYNRSLADQANAQRAAALQQVASGIGLAGTALTSPGAALGQGLSMLGPGGVVAGASLGFLETLGNVGSEGVSQQFDLMVSAITEGLKALPDILFEVLPDFVFSLVTELPPAIAIALAKLLTFGLFNDSREGSLGASFANPGLSAYNEGGGTGGGDERRRGGQPQTQRGTVVNIHGAVTPRALDFLTDEIQNALGPRGRRLSLEPL